MSEKPTYEELEQRVRELEQTEPERERAVDALRESEIKFRTAFDASPDSVNINRLKDGLYVDINEGFSRLTGFTREDVIGKTSLEINIWHDPADREKLVQGLRENGFYNNLEARFRRKDGSLGTGLMSARVISLQNVPHIVSITRDITDRKRMEESLERESAFLSAVFDNIEEAIVICDAKGRLARFNEAARRLHGLPEKPIPPDQWAGHYDLYQRDGITPLPTEDIPLFRALQGDRVQDAEIVVRPKHDRPRSLVCSGQALTNETGRITGAVIAMHDITERKQSEEELKKSEEKYRTIIENMEDGYHEVDLKGNFTLFNESVLKIMGYKRVDLLGMNYRQYADEENARKIYQAYDQVYQTGEPVKNFEWQIIRNDGEYRDIEVTITLIRDMDGHPSGFRGIARDTTDRKRAAEERERLQAQLGQAQKMESIGRLAGGVAHDFNNMLSVILGYTDLALEQAEPIKPLHTALLEIQKAAQHSADVTRQLLAFARKQTIAPKTLDLNHIVKSMLKMLRRLIGEDIDLAWLPVPKLWPVSVDPSQIDQILANLCVNARDAIAGVGKITIETDNVSFDAAYCADHPGFVPGDFILLAVSDDGGGMNKETLDNLFEPFFTTKKVDKGTGLGLATVYGIIKQNNGFINVYSEPDEGTTFKIYLPRHRTAEEPVAKKAPAAPDTSGSETILLVEDEPSILEMTTLMLKRLGYTVLAAVTPGEAINLAREHAGEIHLLMTDVIMPEMNGRDLARNLLTLYPDLKRLFMSGYTANVIAHHGVLDPGVHFIQKPFSMKDMAAKVRGAMGETHHTDD